MSANLDLARAIYAAWERGDFSSADWAHPEIEYAHADGPEPGSRMGLAGMAEAWRSVLNAWEGWSVVADEYRELDSERVLVLNHYYGRGKSSGLEVGGMHARGASLFHFRDGQVVRLVGYFDHDRALADLGLAPQAGPPGS
jgi:ketosteroid isomerase-like protein